MVVKQNGYQKTFEFKEISKKKKKEKEKEEKRKTNEVVTEVHQAPN